MGTSELVIRLVAGVLLIAINGFFVVTEFALTRAPQLGKEAYQERSATRLAWRMTEKLELYLTGCQLGISVASVLLGVVAEPALTALFTPLMEHLPWGEDTQRMISVVIAVVSLQLIHKIWGEQAPTYLGVEAPLKVARITAPIHYGFTKVFYPVILAGDGLAKWTLRLIGVRISRSWMDDDDTDGESDGSRSAGDARRRVIEALGEMGLPRDRREEVQAAVDIDDVPIRDVMTTRDAMRVLDLSAPWSANRKTLSRGGKTRYPLVRGSLDEVAGIIYVPQLLTRPEQLCDGTIDLEALAAPPFTLDADCSVADAIDRFQEARHELALVEQDGRVAGMVTVTDALERIIGQLEDPLDPKEANASNADTAAARDHAPRPERLRTPPTGHPFP